MTTYSAMGNRPLTLDELRIEVQELEEQLASRTKEVDAWIKRYNKSITKQRKIIQDLQTQLEDKVYILDELHDILNVSEVGSYIDAAEHMKKQIQELEKNAELSGIMFNNSEIHNKALKEKLSESVHKNEIQELIEKMEWSREATELLDPKAPELVLVLGLESLLQEKAK